MIAELALDIDERIRDPLYLQIANQIRPLILSGRLSQGMQLPPVREMAADLRVNFNTVARAYRVLESEGWVRCRTGQGTFILERERIGNTSAEEELQEWIASVLRDGEGWGLGRRELSDAILNASRQRSQS